MLPQSYELPVAILLVAGGVLSCFAGYRLFRTVLGFFGFVIGAMFASSMVGAGNTIMMVAAAVIGGLLGALTLILAYFVGIAVIGAGLGALVAHVSWPLFGAGEPPPLFLIALAVAGALGAMWLQRYVILVATAFAGAWTIILGAMDIVESRTAKAAAESAVWVLYPMSAGNGQRWVPWVWLALGLAGTATQLGVTGKKPQKKPKKATSE